MARIKAIGELSGGGGELIYPTADANDHPVFTWDYDAKCIVVFSKSNLGGVNIYSLNASSPKRWWANSSNVWQISNNPNVSNVTSRSITINEIGTTNWDVCGIPLTEYPTGYFT